MNYSTLQLISNTLNYDPSGMTLVGRTWSVGSEYRYGFNGKEQDPETYAEGNIYDYGFRIYNPRLGKFLSGDPLTGSYPWYTPYQFAGNNPIKYIDLDGLEQAYKYPITGATIAASDNLTVPIQTPSGTAVLGNGNKSQPSNIKESSNIIDWM